MATVRDRLNINNRSALDKWTKREQLCLATAVSCSGDQNWMTVSRSLKLLCGAHHPPDWFSQKLCAVKYGELLENVETPKRKKRTTSDNASNVVETPTDSILRRLTEERIQELKSEIREQQETYAKLYTDVVHLQTGNSNEEQIRAMWMEIEREQDLDRQLKARKQMATHEMQRNWRQNQVQQQKQHIALAPVKQEQDMDIDETCKPQGTSPLLSSLLKSSSPAPPVGSTTTTSTVRVSAPTITNLLTGGVVSSSASSSSSSLASSPSSSQASSLLIPGIPLSKPLTGPGPYDSNQPQAQTVLSPSQSAPTLSMLLEKSKPTRDSPSQQQLQTIAAKQLEDEIKIEPASESSPEITVVVKDEDEAVIEDVTIEDGAQTPTKEEEQQLMEVFKNFMPENIDELTDILTSNNGILNPGILEEESILEGVESLMDEVQEVDDQLEVKLTESELAQDSKNPLSMEEDSGAKIKVEEKSNELPSVSQTQSPKNSNVSAETLKEEAVAEQQQLLNEKPKKFEEKVETISSDDSSDDVPLAHTKDAKTPSAAAVDIENGEDSIENNTTLEQPSATVPNEESNQPGEEVHSNITETEEKGNEDQVTVDDDEERSTKNIQSTSTTRKASLSDSSDVIIIPTDDESNDGKAEPETKQFHGSNESAVKLSSKDEQLKPMEGLSQTNSAAVTDDSSFLQEQPITSICLPDTDDDSSTFEAPTAATPKEEKSSLQKQLPASKKHESDAARVEEETKQTLTIRKLRDRDRSESPLVDDDVSDHSVTVRSRRRYSSTPVMDSIPNSPASSEDREFKVWKKPLMSIYNHLLNNKNASMFLRPISEEQNPRYKQVCHRPMDLQIIKRHIDNGTIRNVTDLQRDVFLMCQNAIMVFKNGSSYANMARDLMHEFVQLKDQILDAKMEKSFASSPFTPGVKVRGSARKSQRLP